MYSKTCGGTHQFGNSTRQQGQKTAVWEQRTLRSQEVASIVVRTHHVQQNLRATQRTRNSTPSQLNRQCVCQHDVILS
jgi:hypothetical protein